MSLDLARSVADAVLYEGYLLYPYRASSAKNRARWQFGVLSPPGAAESGLGEAASMSMQCLLTTSPDLARRPAQPASVSIHLRFLQLQRRQLYDVSGEPIEKLEVDDTALLSWDEAVEQERMVELSLTDLAEGRTVALEVDGGTEVEPLTDATDEPIGRMERQRWPLAALLTATVSDAGPGLHTLAVRVENAVAETPSSAAESIRASLIGAHLLVEAHGFAFVSLLDPPPEAAGAAGRCRHDRCWPVLVGKPGSTDLVLGSPIILYDYPEIAAESAGALFDATEIDEILTLRVMTMTEAEKVEARATDPRAAEIIDRCEQLSPAALQELHGILRNPYAEPAVGLSAVPEPQWPVLSDVRDLDPPDFDTRGVPWWDPAVDGAVRPEADAVLVEGVPVAKGSLVRVHPSRRADAQDLFFADQVARVSAVLSDVDGAVHVALVLLDDPAADLHESSGRYFYFAPDELEPVPTGPEAAGSASTSNRANYRKES